MIVEVMSALHNTQVSGILFLWCLPCNVKFMNLVSTLTRMTQELLGAIFFCLITSRICCNKLFAQLLDQNKQNDYT